MRALILALYLLVPLTGGAQDGFIYAVEAPIAPEAVDVAFDIACELSLVDCSTMAAPAVYAGDLTALGAWATYPWPNVIVVDTQLVAGLLNAASVDPMAFSILVHEMTHHIDFVTGALILGNIESICQSEARAWHVSNTWLAHIGLTSWARWDWPKSYEACGV